MQVPGFRSFYVYYSGGIAPEEQRSTGQRFALPLCNRAGLSLNVIVVGAGLVRFHGNALLNALRRLQNG